MDSSVASEFNGKMADFFSFSFFSECMRSQVLNDVRVHQDSHENKPLDLQRSQLTGQAMDLISKL